jgi:hypothetical protein
MENSPDRIGNIYYKAHYVGYKDDTYTERLERTEEWKHLGILGKGCLLFPVCVRNLYTHVCRCVIDVYTVFVDVRVCVYVCVCARMHV